jgi:hypothetical protein
MSIRRLQRQEGLARQALVMFIAAAVVFVILLDSAHVFSAWRAVRSDAKQAASQEALRTLLDTKDPQAAHQAAASYLRANGDIMTALTISDQPLTGPLVTVTATREAKTYVFKYGQHLPLVGKWIKRLLRAHATRDSSAD